MKTPTFENRFDALLGHIPYRVSVVRGVHLAAYSDWGHKNRRLARKPFTMWAAAGRYDGLRAGFETRRDAINWALGMREGSDE